MKKQDLSRKHLLYMLVRLLLESPAEMERFKYWLDSENLLVKFARAKEREPKQPAGPDSKDKVMGRKANPLETELPKETKEKLSLAWLKMFFGIAWRRWMQPGCSLANAWLGAYDMMERKLKTEFSIKNPGAEYLREYAAKRKANTLSFIQKHDHTQEPMNLRPEEFSKSAAIGDTAYSKGLSELNGVLKPLEPKKEQKVENPKAVKFPQMTPQMLEWLRRKQNQKAA